MMKKMRLLLVMCLTMSVMGVGIAQTVIKPGAVWPDDRGNHIQAHGGGIVKAGKYYYWYGEERRQGLDTNYRYVSCYRSEDLGRWKFMGDALQLSDPEQLGRRWVLERPKVYFNRKTKTYVMYFHLDDARYKFARVGVAVSKKPEGPFMYRESFRPLDKESRDIGQFIDDDGTAYLIFESRPTKGFFIAKLSDDYLHVEKAVCLVDAPLEGGAVVHYKGLYYVIGSALTGWRPNPNKYATARSLEGPWSEFRDIAPPGTNTYSSQSTMMLKVEGTKDTTVIFMADQWKPRTQWDSRYLWMPLEIGGGKLWLPEPGDWALDVRTGRVRLREEGSGARSLKDDRGYKVSSPDGTTVFEARSGEGGQVQYRVLWEGKIVMDWSAMGLASGQQERSEGKVEVEKMGESVHKEKFFWPFGEQDSVENNYREMVLRCRGGGLTYDIVARVFDGSVAFRYRMVPGTSLCKIDHEVTGFRFGGNYTLYQYNQESVFTPTAIDTFTKTCDLPATLTSEGATVTGGDAKVTNGGMTQTNGKLFFSIGEAANDNFTKAELRKGAEAHTLVIDYTRDSSIRGVCSTPWRTISISNSAIGLHAFSDLGLRLNPPPADIAPTGKAPAGAEQTSIRPGKLIRAIKLTTQCGLDCIDFAAKHDLQYIMYDAGWYGDQYLTSADPSQVIPAIDMPRVIAYGKQKGIGVILYVNYIGLKKWLDDILPLYKKWGVAGLKFGFVDGLTQEGITWLAEAIRKVNSYGFVLDVHDNYKPTGLSRTYPALLTQEGIRGEENSPDAFHTTVLPFTRFLAGAADFTVCFPNPVNSYSKNIKVSKGQQLALPVVFYSPLQSMFWYGLPGDYTNEDEIEFFKYVPTVWNETHYLAGQIGRNIAVARRQGDTWYLGCMTGFEDWDTTLHMDFLEKGKVFQAMVYEDDGNGGIRKRLMTVRKGDELPVHIRAKGGMAVMIRPVG